MMVLLSLGIAPWAKAQTFDKLWKQVEQAEQKSLLQTVIQLTDRIYKKAETERNSPQMLKAYTWRMKYRETLTPDSFYVSLKGLEQWAETTDKPMDRAVLNSLIAGIYADYASSNRWQIRQRTNIVDEAPSSDIREWSSNMFVQQVMKYTAGSLQDTGLLLNTSSRIYIPFVKLGDTSEYYHHDMLHLLGSRGVDALNNVMGLDKDSVVQTSVENVYLGMLDAYEKAGMDDGYVLCKLDYLNWKRNSDPTFVPYRAPQNLIGLTQDPYLAGLDKLKADFKSHDVCAEVYLAKARYAVEKQQQVMALQICDEAIRLYPDYKRINALKNLKQEILNPALYVRADQVVYPDTDMKLMVNHKNIDGFTVQLYQSKKRVAEQHYSLLRPQNYQNQDTVFTLKAPAIGEYVMRIVPDAKARENSESKLSVTRFKVLTLRLPGDQYEVVVLDCMSGQPVEGAVVTLYTNDEKKLTEFTTDSEGKATFPYKREYRYLVATKGDDTAMPLQGIYGGSYNYYTDKKPVNSVKLLTDRSLYRPGQTVYVKGIAYEQELDTANVIVNRTYTLTLTDANRQEVGKKELRTNEFGSFATEFTLPSVCLNGTFTLTTDEGMTTIRVEEYKRPTFDITFDKMTGSYSLGDKIDVKGTVATFSGVSLQDLPLNYTVTRFMRFGWQGAQLGAEPIASGTVSLNEDGQFTIPVSLSGDKGFDMGYYVFQIQATVTNVAGETQASTYSLGVGNRSMLLGAEIQNPVCKEDSIKLTFKATNLDGQPVSVEGNYKLYPVVGGAKSEEVMKGTPAYTGTFVSNKETLLPGWTSVPSGEYLLVMSAKDDQGREVTGEEEVILFSIKDKRPPVDKAIWYYAENTSFDAAHPAVFYFGTSKKDAYVMMNLFSGNRMLESKVLRLSDSIERFEYPYKESYGNGLSATFCFVKDGSVNQQTVRMTKRLPDKTLTMKWEVFRDKLRPGQEEEWKLIVKTPQGMPAAAEMLATMYDASLDKIWKNNQSLRIGYNLSVPGTRWMDGYWGMNSYNYWFPSKSLKVDPMAYDHFVLPFNYVSNLVFEEEMIPLCNYRQNATVVGSAKVRGMAKAEAGMSIVISDKADVEYAETADADRDTGAGETLPGATEELRTNFAETAFFYPQLRTNEQGEVSFSFTMPQSLTRWNFRGYAHTKGMMTGMIDATAVTSKDFMLTPNLPRFVRVGDKTSVAASVANLTGKNISGTVSFILFDPMTEKVISMQKQKFSVEAGRSTGVSFLFIVTDKYDVLGCRMIADGGSFSDGEQHLLPVLSNKADLVETVAMPVRGEETRTFPLDKLFNNHSKSATDRRLTIEFTGNPAWYAIQALPSLGMPENNNAISWAAAYYANTLAAYIMNSQPRIKAVFDSWKLQGGTKETFLSNLQKNQEVKNILLSESPWVMEARTEEEQKKRIATLFDLNNIRNNNIAALTRLKELQQFDGSWAWYKGMNGSRFITNFIVELNARLALLTGKPLEGDALTMQRSAFSFLNKEALEEYKNIRKAEKNGEKVKGLSDEALKYLYLVAISGEKMPLADNQTAYNYFLSKVGETLTSRSMTNKALAAIVLDKAGRKQEALNFIASLKEFLTKTDEQGMFFAFNENPYTWGGLQIPAHVTVMEALELVSGDSSTVEEMKLWLLKQKQTQAWDSPVTTVNAVFALLQRGVNLLDNQGDVRITVANEVLETLAPAKTIVPGLGYIKKTFTDKKVVDARKITVEKRDAGIAWGAVYAQYQEDIDQVKQQGNELSVEKKLYVERLVNNVRQLQPITAATELAVGDKVVSRLTVRLDRPMDFIQLKDQRAACFEPIGTLSGYRWNNGFGYYVDIKDASTNFFFDGLGKGVYVLEYSYRISRAGMYETGLATIQSAYAPEYVSHSASMKVTIK